MNQLRLFVEAGKKRTFAGAVDWPGYCRSGRDEALAVQTLLNYGERYARVVAEAGLAWKLKAKDGEEGRDRLERTRSAILEALASAFAGNLPEQGPRGGAIWPPRFFVRRVAWHVLDHAWEIEDRVS